MKKKHKKEHKRHGRSRFPWESRDRIVSGSVPARFSPKPADANASPAVDALVKNIMRSGPHYIEENFVRIMQQCYILREEPEFRDLAFDVEDTVEVSLRVQKKYENELLQVMQASEDEQFQLHDEIRAEIIDELATPDFRRDVLRRLDRTLDRLKKFPAADKLELALVLSTLLETKQVPWGLCGLMTAIYSATIERAEQLEQAENDVFGEFRQVFEEANDVDGLPSMMKNPQRLTALAQKIEAKPGLSDHLQRQTEKMTREFEQALASGKVELDLFTDAELLRSYTYLKEYVTANQIDLAKMDPEEMATQFMESIKRAIREIVTPKRVEEMKLYLEKTSQTWLRAKNPRGAALQIELSYLESGVASVENRF
jgi:hypothetical protein